MVVPDTLRDSSRNKDSSDVKGKGPMGKEKGVTSRTPNVPREVVEKPVKSGKARSKKQANDQSGDENNGKGRTPYQGRHHACGVFRCDICENEWFSANSWANCYQICNGCNRGIYPYKQFQPEKSKSRKNKMKKHPEDKCQKCMELGRLCVPLDSTLRKGKWGKKRKGKESHEREE